MHAASTVTPILRPHRTAHQTYVEPATQPQPQSSIRAIAPTEAAAAASVGASCAAAIAPAAATPAAASPAVAAPASKAAGAPASTP